MIGEDYVGLAGMGNEMVLSFAASGSVSGMDSDMGLVQRQVKSQGRVPDWACQPYLRRNRGIMWVLWEANAHSLLQFGCDM